MDGNGLVRVWDGFVRIAHWLLVIAFFVAFVTEGEPMQPHVIAGYVAGVLLVSRIVWGFVGRGHARFSDFVKPPGVVLSYTVDHLRRKSPRYLGHSPAGGAMVVLIMIMLAVTVVSGLGALAESKGEGPLAPFVSMSATEALAMPAIVSSAQAREKHGGQHENEGPWSEAHDVFAHLTLFLALMHVAGVLYTSFAHRENLIWAMVTGRKRAETGTG